MAAYAYTAINARGPRAEGRGAGADRFRPPASSSASRVSSPSCLEEIRAARRHGRAGAESFDVRRRRSVAHASGVKARSLQVFSRQFATMIDAGLNVVTALSILEEQTDDGTSRP